MKSESQTLYHATDRTKLPSIMRDGLLTSKSTMGEPIVCLSDRESALEFCDNFSDPVIIAVSLPRDWPLFPDPFVGDLTCVSREDIPVKYLRVERL